MVSLYFIYWLVFKDSFIWFITVCKSFSDNIPGYMKVLSALSFFVGIIIKVGVPPILILAAKSLFFWIKSWYSLSFRVVASTPTVFAALITSFLVSWPSTCLVAYTALWYL